MNQYVIIFNFFRYIDTKIEICINYNLILISNKINNGIET